MAARARLRGADLFSAAALRRGRGAGAPTVLAAHGARPAFLLHPPVSRRRAGHPVPEQGHVSHVRLRRDSREAHAGGIRAVAHDPGGKGAEPAHPVRPVLACASASGQAPSPRDARVELRRACRVRFCGACHGREVRHDVGRGGVQGPPRFGPGLHRHLLRPARSQLLRDVRLSEHGGQLLHVVIRAVARRVDDARAGGGVRAALGQGAGHPPTAAPALHPRALCVGAGRAQLPRRSLHVLPRGHHHVAGPRRARLRLLHSQTAPCARGPGASGQARGVQLRRGRGAARHRRGVCAGPQERGGRDDPRRGRRAQHGYHHRPSRPRHGQERVPFARGLRTCEEVPHLRLRRLGLQASGPQPDGPGRSEVAARHWLRERAQRLPAVPRGARRGRSRLPCGDFLLPHRTAVPGLGAPLQGGALPGAGERPVQSARHLLLSARGLLDACGLFRRGPLRSGAVLGLFLVSLACAEGFMPHQLETRR